MSCVNVDDGYDARRTLKRVYDFLRLKIWMNTELEFFGDEFDLRCCRVSIDGAVRGSELQRISDMCVNNYYDNYSLAGQAFALRSEPHLCGVVLLTA